MSAERRPRLNPFAFPSDTVFRFGLLVVAVLGANLYVWQWIASTTRSTDEHVEGTRACLAVVAQGADAFSGCVSELYRYQVSWMVGGTIALALASAAILLAYPAWIARQRRLVPLGADDAPAAVARVRELAAELGVDPPELLWNPLDPSPTGLAFGRPGRYAVAVGGGLVVKQTTDPAAFDAVVRHELAHLRNRDVGVTYLTLATWYAFLAVAVLPFVLTLLGEGRGVLVGVTWRLLALALLVYLTRNAVLRSREVYADVRASTTDGPDGALRRVVGGLPTVPRDLLGRIRAVHPAPAERLAAVDDTRPLFPLGAAAAFAAGLSSTIAYESVVQLLSTYIDDAIDLRLAAALAYTPLAIGVVGVAIWREAFAAHADGREPASPWLDGLAFALGLLLGPELALSGIVTVGDTLVGSLDSAAGLVWAGLLVSGVVLLLAWIRMSASWWVRALGGRHPIAAGTAGLVVAAGALTGFMGAFYGLRTVSDALAFSRAGTAAQHAAVDAQVWTVPRQVWQLVMDPLTLVVVQKPLYVPVLALLALFPFAALLVRRRPAEAPWAWLEPGGELRTPRLTLRWLWPLAVGAAVGLAYLLAIVVVRFWVHASASPETRATDAAVLSFYVGTLALALLFALAAGALGTLRGGLVGALAAAFVACCFGWLAIVGGPMLGGCVNPLSLNPGPCAWTVPAAFSWDVFQQVVAEGVIAGLAGGLAALAVQALARRRRAEALQPAGAAP